MILEMINQAPYAGIIWTDVLLMDGVIHEAVLRDHCLEVLPQVSFFLLLLFNVYAEFKLISCETFLSVSFSCGKALIRRILECKI